MKDRAAAQVLVRRIRETVDKSVPYNLSVHTFSNLRLDAELSQKSREPGGTAVVLASLVEYDVPLVAEAKVWATITGPGGALDTAGFDDLGGGRYQLEWPLKRVGAYRFVVHAEGRTSGGDPFTRERVLTAGVWRGGDKPWEPVEDLEGQDHRRQPSKPDERLRGLLAEVDQSPDLRTRLAGLGFDVAALRSALEPALVGAVATPGEPDPASVETDDLEARFTDRATTGPLSAPVQRTPKRPGRPGNLFVIEGFANPEGGEPAEHEDGHPEPVDGPSGPQHDEEQHEEGHDH